MGGVFAKLVERNTTIPTHKTQMCSTAEDNQEAVDIYVFQGERAMARDNKLLGNFRLDGISKANRGEPRIEVSFDIDANGILNVSAKDLNSGKEQKITITASTNLEKEDIDRMVKEAESHASEDKERKAHAELKNESDSLIYTLEREIKKNEEHISQANKDKAQELMNKVRQQVQDAAPEEEIKETMNDLRGLMVLINQEVSQATASTSEAKGEDSEESKESDDSKDSEEAEEVKEEEEESEENKDNGASSDEKKEDESPSDGDEKKSKKEKKGAKKSGDDDDDDVVETEIID